MLQTTIKPVLMTQEALRLKNWNGLQWFGIEEMYIPYTWLDEFALGYGESIGYNRLQIEVYESFEYLAAYKNKEYVATFEFPFITVTGQIITLEDFGIEIKL